MNEINWTALRRIYQGKPAIKLVMTYEPIDKNKGGARIQGWAFDFENGNFKMEKWGKAPFCSLYNTQIILKWETDDEFLN